MKHDEQTLNQVILDHIIKEQESADNRPRLNATIKNHNDRETIPAPPHWDPEVNFWG